MDSPADLLTTTQAAAILGVDASRVRQLVAAGRLPAIKPGYDWLITRADVEAARAGGDGEWIGRHAKSVRKRLPSP